MIEVSWAADDKKAILFSFQGDWDASTLQTACKESGRLLRDHDRRCHFILDFTNNEGFLPQDALTIFHQASHQITIQVGLIVIVTVRTTLARRIAHTLSRLGVTSLHPRLIFANSVGEALYATGSLNSMAAV